MKDGLIDKINSHGHWRVNIRPTRDINETMSFQKSREVVERSSVSIRGWNYPHVSRRSDDYGGIANGENFVESWTDWDGFIEFWRMYRSSQFLSYFCLRSDTGAMGQELSGARELSILDAIYSICPPQARTIL